MQSIAGIINCLVSHKETNMQELYEQGEYLESVVGIKYISKASVDTVFILTQ
jgi:hypothetical protein